MDFAPKLLAQKPAVLCDEPHIVLAAAPVACGQSQPFLRAGSEAMLAKEFEAPERGNSAELSALPTLPTHLPAELLAAVEAWAERQPDKPILAEAIRRIVDLGLATD